MNGAPVQRLPTFEEWHGHPTRVMEGWFDKLARTIAWDFDGVLHPYTNGWTGSTPDDEPPVPGVRDVLAALQADGYRQVVFSTRANHVEGADGIAAWLDAHDLARFFDEVTHSKPPAIAYVDDRAVPFVGDWAAVRDGIERLGGGRSHGAAPTP